MKMYRRFLAMLLAGVLFLSCVPAFALTSAEKENNYNAAVLQLETYLESYGNDSTELLDIAAVFEDLHGYAKSTSFVNYISVLMKIADEEYDSDMDFLLSMLEVNEGFKKYLEDMRNDSSIGTINELEAYARARECEHNGNAEAAMKNYRQCLDFFDSQHRLTALYNAGNETAYAAAFEKIQAGDYAGAYYAFSEISRYGDSAERMKAIVNLLGYTPEDASDNLPPATELKITKATIDEMTLSWQKSSHAQQYEVYYKEANQAEWKHAADTAETTMTVIGLKQGTSYDFKVIAAIGRLKADEAILTNQKTASATPTLSPTPAPKNTSPAPTSFEAPSVASAYDFKYSIENGKVTISKYNGTEIEVRIPDKIDGYPVNQIGLGAFSNCTTLKKIIIPEGITRIGILAFRDCINLESITIPDSINTILRDAFVGCDGVKEIHINSIESWMNIVFKDFNSMPNHCGNCKLFIGDNELINLILPEGIERIPNSFYGFCSLKSIVLPSSLISIDPSAFSHCNNLLYFNIAGENATYTSQDGIIFSKNKATLIKCPYGKTGSYNVPNHVSTIGKGAFSGCVSLTSITIPSTVTTIGESAFSNCESLKNVILPNTIALIDSHVFSECESLNSIIIPDSVTSIGHQAFYKCISLTSLSIPSGVTRIEDFAFSGCTNLTSVTIPSSITSIGSSSFQNCIKLTNVTIPNGVIKIGFSTFENCSCLTSVTIPSSVTQIGLYAFRGCNQSLTIYGSSNSAAEKYAKENEIPFVRK